jgi:NAD(P)-dependent dehydrogenase (short-subunit alcohol dehydrogenase family)
MAEREPKLSFAGRVAILTSFGDELSIATARYLVEAGASVLIHDSLRDPIGSRAAAEDLLKSATGADLRLDILINGRPAPAAEQESTRKSQWAADTALLTEFAIPFLRRSEAGRIVSVVSGLGQLGSGEHISTAMADAAVTMFSKSTALRLAGSTIAANAISPIMSTDSERGVIASDWSLNARMYTADCVVPVIAYLCHKICALNGEVISAGGGRVGRFVTGATLGYFNSRPTPSDIAERLSDIMSIEHLVYPRSADDELLMINV